MAIKVVTGQQTFVKKIVVGTPISTAQTGLSIDNFSDFKVATKSEGQILVYDSAEGAFKNFTLTVGNGLEKFNTPGTDQLALQIDSSSTPTITGLTTLGNIVPAVDSAVDLGDSAKKFRDLYLSGGTIHLGNIDLKDSSGGFAATDSTGAPVNFNLQGSIPQIRRMFAGGGDLSYDTGTGVFQFDVEQVYTKENFDSDFNLTLDSAVLEGVGLNYSNASNTLNIDSAELEAFFKPDIRGYFTASNTLSYNSSTGDFRLPQPLDSGARPTFNKVKIPDGGLGVNDARIILGNDSDLKIFHSGSHSIIRDAGTGSLLLQTNNFTVQNATGTENQITALSGGAVSLYHNDSAKLATTSTGVTITGTVNADSSTLTNLTADSGVITDISGSSITYDSAHISKITADSAIITDISGATSTFNTISGEYLGFDSDLARITSRQTIRGYVSATDGGGDGSFAYNASTGVFTYTGPSATEVRAHFTGGSGISDSVNVNGIIDIDSAELYSLYKHDDFSDFVADEHVAHTGVSIIAGKGLLGGGNIASSRTIDIDSANVKAMLSANDAGGDGSFSYNNSTGVFTYTGPSASEVYAHLSGGGGIADSVNTDGVIRIDSSELYSLYKHDDFSDFVADEHVAHTGVSIVAGKGLLGGGNIASSRTIDIDSANVRGMFSGGTGVTYNSANGQISIGQAVGTSDNVTFNQVRGPAEFIIDPATVGDNTGTVKILGNLQVEGTQTIINSTTVSVNDKNIVLADSAADASAADGAGITINGASATLTYSASGDKFVFNKPFEGEYLGFDSDFDSALSRINSRQTIRGYVSGGTGISYNATTGVITSNDGQIVHDNLSGFVANEHIDHTTVSITAGVGLKGGGTIASTRDLAIDSSELTTYYRPLIRSYFSGGAGIADSLNVSGVVKIDSAELYSLYKHDDFSDFVADEHVAHTGVSIVAGKGLTGGGNIASSRTIDIDSANVRGMFSAGGDLSYNSGTGQFSFDVEDVYTKANFDSDYFLAKDSANTAVERNKHDTTTKNFAVTVAAKSGHVYQGQGSGNAYVIDGTQSPIINLKMGRTYRFTLSSSDMSSHPFRFYYDAARASQYTTGVSTTSTYAEIAVDSATPPVLHYQCSSHPLMGHALQIGTRNFTGFTTTNLTEGTNLYYTDGRFDTRFASKSTTNLSEGSNLYYTDARARAVSLDSAEAQAMIDSNFTNMDIDFHLPDDKRITFGDDSDLEIFHNGSHSVIRDGGTGNLELRGSTVKFANVNGSKTGLIANQGGAIELYHDNSKKLETTAYGATVTGTINADSATFTNINLPDNGTIILGDSGANDFFIKYSGTQSQIAGTKVRALTSDFRVKNPANNETYITALQNGQVELYYNNLKRLETGIDNVQILNVDGGASKLKVSSNNNSIGTNAAAVELYANFFRKAGLSIFGDSIGASSPIEEWFIGRPYGQSAQPLHITSNTSGQKSAVFNQLGSVELYYNNVKKLETSDSGVNIIGELTTDSATIEAGVLHIKNIGEQSQVRLYCEDNNQHYAAIQAPAHATFGGNVVLTLPSATGTLISTSNSNAPTTTTSASDADFVLIDDGGTMKKITPANLGISSGITIQDSGGSLSTLATTLNFVGAGVVASGSGSTKTITISGGGGGGGGGAVAGGDTQVQFNDGGNFGADGEFTFNKTSNTLTIGGPLIATSKSFDIKHPTKKGKRLRYGSLEGPENGVYIRGRANSSKINLPDYWTGLVDEETITVELTPIGKHQKLYVEDIANNVVTIGNDNMIKKDINCFYTIYGERKDIDKLTVEY